MPNVLILGGTGYLGLALGQALLRSGSYQVWATTRSAEKAKSLLANEVRPVVIADVADKDALSSVITKNKIDLVIDVSSAYEKPANVLGAVIAASKARAAALAAENAIGPKLGFIYASGSWVYGSPKERVSDLSPVGNKLASGTPNPLVAWRPAHEQAILAARDTLDVAIFRLATLYGRSSWVFGTFWSSLLPAKGGASSAKISIPADTTSRHGILHVDDAAAAFVAAAERIDGRLGTWPIFDIAAESVSLPEIMEAAKESLGVTAPLEFVGTGGNPFLDALSLAANSDGAVRARTILAWEPRRRDFIANIPIVVEAWEASQK